MRNYAFLVIVVLFWACSNLSQLNVYDGISGHPWKVERKFTECILEDSLHCFNWNTIIVDSFDSKGRKFVTRFLDSTKTDRFETHFTYDRRGNLIGEAIGVVGQEPRERKKYVYNKQGLKTFELTIGRYRNFSLEGEFVSKECFMLYKIRNSDGKVTGQRKLYYDALWRNTRLIDMDSIGQPYRWQDFDYDEKGNQVEIRWYWQPEEVTKWMVKTYDSRSDLIRQQVFTLVRGDTVPGNVMEYSYDYDDNGNWTEQRTYENDILKWVIHRKIYYRNTEKPRD